MRRGSNYWKNTKKIGKNRRRRGHMSGTFKSVSILTSLVISAKYLPWMWFSVFKNISLNRLWPSLRISRIEKKQHEANFLFRIRTITKSLKSILKWFKKIFSLEKFKEMNSRSVLKFDALPAGLYFKLNLSNRWKVSCACMSRVSIERSYAVRTQTDSREYEVKN